MHQKHINAYHQNGQGNLRPYRTPNWSTQKVPTFLRTFFFHDLKKKREKSAVQIQAAFRGQRDREIAKETKRQRDINS